MLDRRSFLKVALAAPAFAALPANARMPGLRLGAPQPFSYEALKAQAQTLAAAPLVRRPDPIRRSSPPSTTTPTAG
jgi:glucans biosynthesis protein